MIFTITRQPPLKDSKEREEEIEADSVKLDDTWATFYRMELVDGLRMPVLHIAIPATEVIQIRRDSGNGSKQEQG